MLFGTNKNEKRKKAFDQITGNSTNEHPSSTRSSISSTSTIRSAQQYIRSELSPSERTDSHTNHDSEIEYDDEEDFLEGEDLERASDDSRDNDAYLQSSEDDEYEEGQQGRSFDDNFLWNARQLCARQGGNRLFSEEEPFLTSSEVQINLAKLEKYTRKMMEDEKKNKRVFKETTDTLRQSLNEHKRICVTQDVFQSTIKQLVNCIETLKNTIISLNGTVPPLDTPTLDEGTSGSNVSVERRGNRRRGRGISHS